MINECSAAANTFCCCWLSDNETTIGRDEVQDIIRSSVGSNKPSNANQLQSKVSGAPKYFPRQIFIEG